MDMVVAVVDVGKLSNVGWWRIAENQQSGGGTDLDVLVAALVDDLESGHRVALGFEAPLFIPRPSTAAGLGKSRRGEGRFPWCVRAGATALAFGIQQASYVMDQLARGLGQPISAGLDVAQFLHGGLDLVLWEAFVSLESKDPIAPDPHVADARAAAEEFQRRASTGGIESDIADTDVLNLVAAPLIASGLTTDVSLLGSACTVVKPPPYWFTGRLFNRGSNPAL
jgi:hypothetical protein